MKQEEAPIQPTIQQNGAPKKVGFFLYSYLKQITIQSKSHIFFWKLQIS